MAAYKVTMTSNEIRRKVMTIAHTNFKSKYNKCTWGEVLRRAWGGVKLLIRIGTINVKKAIKIVKQPKVETFDIFAGMNVSPEEAKRTLGYGCGRYCGD